jgi:hypothetical protein
MTLHIIYEFTIYSKNVWSAFSSTLLPTGSYPADLSLNNDSLFPISTYFTLEVYICNLKNGGGRPTSTTLLSLQFPICHWPDRSLPLLQRDTLMCIRLEIPWQVIITQSYGIDHCNLLQIHLALSCMLAHHVLTALAFLAFNRQSRDGLPWSGHVRWKHLLAYRLSTLIQYALTKFYHASSLEFLLWNALDYGYHSN